ncbi:HD domain-containing protein [Herbaspirillum robiniae]|uniref:HD domain-containing protein n=1 Tax=Herbaspirillum robiniae TaxID=2014887 RepID=UPI003D76F022
MDISRHLAAFSPFEALAAELLPHVMDDAGDGSHDISHLVRVWNNVRRLQAQEGGDLRLLLAAVLLHDCVRVEKNSPLRSQASTLSGRQAAGILQALGWSAEQAAEVAHAVEAHSFSAAIAPRSAEAKILQDADRLDAIGAIGVARCFYTAGRMGSSLYDAADPQAAGRALDDRRYALDHFPAKLFRLSEGFQTVAGAAMARAREETMRRFVSEMFGEL